LNFDQLAALKTDKSVREVTCVSDARDYLGVNLKDPILSNELVRRAISLALNRSAIVKSVYQGFAVPSDAGVSSAFGATQGKTYYTYNVAEAKSLLTQAGYPNGFPLTLTVSPGEPGAYVSDLAVEMQSDLAAVGITVTISTIASSTDFASALAGHTLQSWIQSESPAFFNPGYSELLTENCHGLSNYGAYCNTGMDAIAKSLDSVKSLKTASSLINRLSVSLDNNMPVIYIADISKVFAENKCVQSLPLNSSGPQYQVALAQASCKG
jgi:ABC-type transport system substrate-binding protein